MQFTVPQFIERKPKIVGPLTFEQFIFVGVAGAISLFLYFTVPLSTFIVAATFLFALAISMAFLKIEKTPLPIVIKNFFIFSINSKVYLWRKKIIPYKMTFEPRKKEKEPEIEKKESNLKIAGQSRLKDLLTHLESKK